MTKEEFRRQLMKQAIVSAWSDKMTEVCVQMQIAMNEVDAEKILDMPSTRFDLIMEEFIRQQKRTTGTGLRGEPRGFG